MRIPSAYRVRRESWRSLSLNRKTRPLNRLTTTPISSTTMRTFSKVTVLGLWKATLTQAPAAGETGAADDPLRARLAHVAGGGGAAAGADRPRRLAGAAGRGKARLRDALLRAARCAAGRAAGRARRGRLSACAPGRRVPGRPRLPGGQPDSRR